MSVRSDVVTAKEPPGSAAALPDLHPQPASLSESAKSGEVAAVALKEWAVVCAALSCGEQIVRPHFHEIPPRLVPGRPAGPAAALKMWSPPPSKHTFSAWNSRGLIPILTPTQTSTHPLKPDPDPAQSTSAAGAAAQGRHPRADVPACRPPFPAAPHVIPLGSRQPEAWGRRCIRRGGVTVPPMP